MKEPNTAAAPSSNHLQPQTFVVACRNFFGILPNQTLQQFAGELRALTPADKQDLIEMFKGVGIDASKVS